MSEGHKSEGFSAAEASVNSERTKVVTLASGAVVEIKKFTGKHRDMWSSKKVMENSGLSRIFDDIVVKVHDPGVYSEYKGRVMGGAMEVRAFDPQSGKIDWRHALEGDRFNLLLEARVFTYGPDFEFQTTCPSQHCRHRQSVDADLTKLPVVKLPEESAKIFAGGNRFLFRLPDCGREIAFKLDTGKDEENMVKMRKAGQLTDNEQTDRVRKQIVAIEGVSESDITRFIRDEMSDGDICELQDEMDRVGCGVDTSIQVECNSCGYVYEVDLPFSNMLSPQKGAKRRRMERLAALG